MHVLKKKFNTCIKGPAQFKPMLFKGQLVYLKWLALKSLQKLKLW